MSSSSEPSGAADLDSTGEGGRDGTGTTTGGKGFDAVIDAGWVDAGTDFDAMGTGKFWGPGRTYEGGATTTR